MHQLNNPVHRPIHREIQPHKFAISWTTSRTLSATGGANFYIAEYGIRIRQAPNTVIIWIPGDYHGTSLPDASPEDLLDEVVQAGFCFVTSNRLVSQWRKFHEGIVEERDLAKIIEELERIMEQHEDEDYE